MSSESNLLTNELLLTLKNLSGYKYSPEKNKILYLISQSDLKENKSNKELYIMNSDGSEVEQCGNGVRCFARFVHERQLTNKTKFK